LTMLSETGLPSLICCIDGLLRSGFRFGFRFGFRVRVRARIRVRVRAKVRGGRQRTCSGRGSPR